MAIELVTEPTYRITGKPGLDGLIFTRSSEELFTWPQPVRYCDEKKSILQSLREAAGFRTEAGGEDHANECQATRTTAVYFITFGTQYVAFDDIADPKANIILARAQEGRDACKRHNQWHLPLRDMDVGRLLVRAEKDGRIVEVPVVKVPEQNAWPLNSYARQPIIKASLGDVAQQYAQFLTGKGYKTGGFRTPPKTAKDTADVQVVIFGGSDFGDFNMGVIDTRQLDGYCGRARGVRGSPQALAWKA